MIYLFSDFQLDTNSCVLTRGGRPIDVESQVFSLLAVLVEKRDHVVSKDELIDLVWSGRLVSEATIASRIHAVRAALGDNGRQQLMVKTFSGRGYRFVAEVDAQPGRSLAGTPAQRAALAVNVARDVPGFQDRPTVVITPFEALSLNDGDVHVANGITEELSIRLGQARTFPVVSCHSARSLKEGSASVAEIGRRLGVRYLVEGSVQRSGERLRVGVHLVSVQTLERLWSERFEVRFHDLFQVQDEIASTVAGLLEQHLISQEIGYEIGVPLDDLQTWQIHLRGLYHLYRSTREDNRTALNCFRTTISRDPGYGPAYGGLAMAHVFGHGAGWLAHDDSSVTTMAEAGQATIRLSPRDPNGHVSWGWSLLCKGELHAAVDAIHSAVENNPSSALAWYYLSCALSFAGEPQASIEKADRALRLSPLDPMVNRMWAIKARSYYLLGDYEKAIEINRALARSPDGLTPLATRDLAAALVGAGHLDEAKIAIRNLLQMLPGYSLRLVEATYPWENPDQLNSYLSHLRVAGLQ